MYRWIGLGCTFFMVQKFPKNLHIMQIFQEKRKKTWISTWNIANFQKIFMPNCSPSIFTYPYVIIPKPEKIFFSSIFSGFLGRKKIFRIFSGKQPKSFRNYFLIIFKHFSAIFDEICIFFHWKIQIFWLKIFMGYHLKTANFRARD